MTTSELVNQIFREKQISCQNWSGTLGSIGGTYIHDSYVDTVLQYF